MELVYFPVRGRGESIRLLFADKGVEYKETSCKDDWPKLKPTMAFGQVPALRDGSLQLVQSNAILRYLARKFNLYGDSIEEAAMMDQLNDGVEDLRCIYVRMIYQDYENGKEEFIKKLPERLQPFENLLERSKSSETGYAVAGKSSFVDYNLFDLLDILQVLAPDCLQFFFALSDFYSKVLNRPGVKTYRETEGFKARPINGNDKK